MRLLSLEVENYRNIASASLTPGRELTVICGNNGQGKTNLLEAIWLLTGGKSFRGGKDAELVRRGEPFAVLKASTLRAQQEEQETEEPNRVRLTVGAPDSPRPGRTVSVNGGAVKRAASLAGSFPAVVFDPGHLSLVKGAPEGRRKFLDAALCQLYPGYLTLYRRYVRALQQKNALLRRSSNGMERPYAEKRALLEVLNVELAQQGEAIQQRRRAYLAALSPLACANYEELSRGAETLSLRYAAQFEPGGLAALLRARQNETLVAELSRRQKVTGVHMFCLGEEAVYCSNFAPLYDIPEECATGTSNGALTYYLYERSLVEPERENLFLQGEHMERPSRILSRLTVQDGVVRVRIGGQAVMSLAGEMDL